MISKLIKGRLATQTKIRITTVSREIEFQVSPKTQTSELFHQICRNVGIRETWYFGLYFYNADNEKIWIDCSKKKIRDYKAISMKLKFGVKYMPEDVSVDLIEPITVKYFFLEVRADILSDKIYCPPDTCVLLASYAAQTKYGDFNDSIDVSKELLLPERVYKQHNIDKDTFEDTIYGLWKKHRGLVREDAMREYLKLAQNLEMYGVHYFDITNTKGSHILLGIQPLGVCIFMREDRLNPVIMFPWSEISNLNFRGKRFIIKTVDKQGKDFTFFTVDGKINKRILNLGIGYHLLYVRRRKPDTLEILQMKESASAHKKSLESQREKLREEIRNRELMEKREKQYQLEIQILKDQVDFSRQNLLQAQETIQQLKEQLRALQEAKENLERRENELFAMMESLEASKNLEYAERQKLEDEIIAKQLEVRRIRDEVAEKDAETKRLQEAVEEAKRKEEERLRQQMEEIARNEREMELEQLPENANTELPELTEVNEQLKQQLKELQDKLNQSRNENLETKEDKIHRDNLSQRKDKYKTLNEIRKGNTVRRVDLFENL